MNRNSNAKREISMKNNFIEENKGASIWKYLDIHSFYNYTKRTLSKTLI